MFNLDMKREALNGCYELSPNERKIGVPRMFHKLSYMVQKRIRMPIITLTYRMHISTYSWSSDIQMNGIYMYTHTHKCSVLYQGFNYWMF
jgi:hypothetical protein